MSIVTPSRNILLVRNDRLGDTILALPAFNVLRSAFPDAKIHFLASPAVAQIIRCVEGVDSVIESDDHGNPPVLDIIRSLSIDTAICLRPTWQNSLLLYRSNIPNRIGTKRRWFSPLFTKRLNLSRRKSNRHEANLNLDIVYSLGIRGEAEFPSINLPELAENEIETLLASFGLVKGDPFVILHPGSGGSARDWPVEYFKCLADYIDEKLQINVLVTGSLTELEKCQIVAGEHHLNLCGKTDLLQLAALIRRSSLLVAGSTGSLHLAVALGRPVVGLYPPVAGCTPERWGPYHHPEWALAPELPECRKCRAGSISSCFCMEQLSPETVGEKVRQTLAESC
jgi:heptosyltransferase-3